MVANGTLTIICDNSVEGKGDLLGENGLSILVELNGKRYLFDTGHGRTILHNADLLRLPIRNLDGLIISHSHPDHAGGLPEIIKSYDSLPVFAHPYLFNYRYRTSPEGKKIYGGIPFTQAYLEKQGAHFFFNRKAYELEPGLYLTGEIPRKNTFEHADMENRFINIDGAIQHDIVLEEQALVIPSEKGLIIISGCSHAGIVNTIDAALTITAYDSIYCIIGGTHLGFADQEQIRLTIKRLHDYPIERLVTGHCTGIDAAVKIKDAFPDSFEFSHVGKQIVFKPHT